MIAALAVLLTFQLLGEAIAQVSHLPVPGPVIGMVLLFLALQWHSALPESLRTTAQTLLSHLSLLFVPAGVGVIQYGALLAKEWLALTISRPAEHDPDDCHDRFGHACPDAPKWRGPIG